MDAYITSLFVIRRALSEGNVSIDITNHLLGYYAAVEYIVMATTPVGPLAPSYYYQNRQCIPFSNVQSTKGGHLC